MEPNQPTPTTRRALVAGAAGLLGAAACDAFVALGWDVAGLDSRAFRKDRVKTYRADVTNLRRLADALRAVCPDGSSLHAVVNCAGVNDAVERWHDNDHPRHDSLALLNVNILGTANLLEVAAPYLKDHAGAVVSISSLYSVVASDPRLYWEIGERDKDCLYEASKAAVVALTRHYAVRLARRGIRVNSIAAGGVANNQPAAFIEAYQSRVPLGRMATTEDIVRAIVFLVSPESAYISGQNLVVDGGYSVW